MTNPYSGIITAAFKQTFDNAIDALLENTALTVPCRLEYGDTKFTECSNCIIDPSKKISANKYKPGGAIEFPTGSICPACNGKGLIATLNTESLYMAVIWNENRSKMIQLGFKLDDQKVYAMSICDAVNWPKIDRTNLAILNTNLEGYGRQRYERVGDPTPMTFGFKTYIFTLWQRAQ